MICVLCSSLCNLLWLVMLNKFTTHWQSTKHLCDFGFTINETGNQNIGNGPSTNSQYRITSPLPCHILNRFDLLNV